MGQFCLCSTKWRRLRDVSWIWRAAYRLRHLRPGSDLFPATSPGRCSSPAARTSSLNLTLWCAVNVVGLRFREENAMEDLEAKIPWWKACAAADEHASALQQASNGCCSCCWYLNWLLFQCSLHTSWTLSLILDPSQSLLYHFGFHPSCVCGDDVTSWNMVTWRPHWDSSSDKSRIFPKIFLVLHLGLKWTEISVYLLETWI